MVAGPSKVVEGGVARAVEVEQVEEGEAAGGEAVEDKVPAVAPMIPALPTPPPAQPP